MPRLAEFKQKSCLSRRWRCVEIRTTNWKKIAEPLVLLRSPSVIRVCIHSTFCLACDRMRLNAIPRPQPGPWPNTPSERWHFVNAMTHNPSCSLMTPFREEGAWCWPALIFLTHMEPSILFWHDIITSVCRSQRNAGRGTATDTCVCYVCIEGQGGRHRIRSTQEFPWRRARHGLASLKMLMEAE